MTEQTITISKSGVLDEVSRTTSYAGSKKKEPEAYGNEFATDSDADMLERFWDEGCSTLLDLFKPFLGSAALSGTNYVITLSLSSSYDTSLTAGVTKSAFSFLSDFIVAKWYNFINREEAQSYAKEADAMYNDIRSKIYFKKKPTRPTHS